MLSKSKSNEVEKVKYCRICGYYPLKSFLTLGPLPTPNGFLEKKDLKKNESVYPLTIGRCINCGLVQLTEVVQPNIMFSNYKYVPSASRTMIYHFDEMAEDLTKSLKLNKKSLVIDIGSNDGTLLKSFKKRGSKVLGIDPAENLAVKASKEGIETIADFFGAPVAKKVAAKYGKAKLITGTNVIAHIPKLHSVFRGVKALLRKDGTFVMEFPYLVDLLENTEFDTIYQEHISYFSVKPLVFMSNTHGFHITDIQKQEVHGGSIRVFMRRGKKRKLSKAVIGLLALEDAKNIYSQTVYDEFVERVETKKKQLTSLLKQLKKEGYKIAGYGASARGNILLNYFKIDTKILDYIVDSTPYKQGLFTPGHHIPIKPETEIYNDKPDYILLLAWNFKEEILKKQDKYRQEGGKFILIVPKVEIV